MARRRIRSDIFDFLGSLLVMAACGGGGDGLSGPDPDPVVTSIAPMQARPGEQVTITGSRFGSDASNVTVTFNGQAGSIVSITATTIVAVVPVLAEGPANLIVTVGGRPSSSVTLNVLRALPVITGLSPASVRQGETLTISGQNLLAARHIAPAGAAIEVLLDGEPLTPQSVTGTQIVVTIPMSVEPGTHELRLRRGDELSNVVNVSVEVFTVTGTYELLGVVAFNDCPPDIFEFAVGDTVFTFALITDSRPSMTLVFRASASNQGPTHSGLLHPNGSFTVQFVEGSFVSDIFGGFGTFEEDVIFSGTHTFEDEICRTQIDFVAVRTSTSLDAVRPAPGTAGAITPRKEWHGAAATRGAAGSRRWDALRRLPSLVGR